MAPGPREQMAENAPAQELATTASYVNLGIRAFQRWCRTTFPKGMSVQLQRRETGMLRFRAVPLRGAKRIPNLINRRARQTVTEIPNHELLLVGRQFSR